MCVLISNKNNGISESINNDQNSFILFQMVLKQCWKTTLVSKSSKAASVIVTNHELFCCCYVPFFLWLIHTQISQNLWIFNAFSMLMLMLVCLHEVVHKILISSFQLQEGWNRKTILLAKVTSATSSIGLALHFCDTVPLMLFEFSQIMCFTLSIFFKFKVRA